ncbi:MAG: type IV pilin [Euryarchaeota archaeon]|nr:type IV pilin [Euryarchaeota archaeon]
MTVCRAQGAGRGVRGRGGRRFQDDRRGVSETLGDILLVVTSVIMLSALATQLMSLPPPAGTLEADTVASFDGTNVTIEHVGGAVLRQDQVTIQIGKDYSLPARFSISQGHPDGALGVGEVWTRNVSAVVSPDDRVHVVVVNTRDSRVLSDQFIRRPQDYSLLPDVGLSADDISFWRAGSLVDDGDNAPVEGDILAVQVVVHNFGRVPVNNITVASSVFMYTALALEPRLVPFLNSSGNPGDTAVVSVPWPITAWGPHSVYVRAVPLRNESVFTNNYASRQIRIGPGITTPDAPDLNITSISFSNNHPIHGDAVKMFVRIANQGGVPAMASVTYWDNGVELFTDYNLSVSAGQLLEVDTVWLPSFGGIHRMFANVSVINGPPDDANPDNNNRTVYIEVLPTVLLVDDDKAGPGTLKDATSAVEAALSAVSAEYTYYEVSGGDGPKYDTGPAKRRLADFDLVIWVTGHERTSTLTPNDMASLSQYMDHGGKLWLIGQDLVNDLRSTAPAWLSGYLHVSGQVLDAGLYNPLEGVPENFVTCNMTLPVNSIPWAGGLTDLADKLVNDSRSVAALWNSSTSSKYALMFNATTNSSGPTYTMALFSFEFSQLRSANDRANLTFHMLKWFDCLARYGRDLALSEQVIGKLNPDFMEEVNITVWVRNNGQGYEPEGGDRVLVLFLMDNSPIPPYQVYINDTLMNGSMTTNPVEVPGVPGDGGVVRVTIVWLANRVGSHAVRVSVDPFNFIAETNEDNNEVWGSATSSLVVRYSILVVDDDDSPNNRAMATFYNSTFEFQRALERLGYTATTYVVPGPGINGPSESYLRRFNTVIWLTGQCAPGAPNPLTSQDETNLKGFLSAGDDRGLWLIGQDMFPTGIYGAGSFLYDFLHVSAVNRGVGMPDPLLGVRDDPVGHGINYTTSRTFGPVTGGSRLTPRADARGVTYLNPAGSSYNAVRFDSSSMGYRTLLCGYDLSFIAGRGTVPETEYESELVYMALHWLGLPETRVELRVTEMDMYYGNLTPIQGMHPAMGNSYVVKAVVANPGGARGDCSVRFLDGSTVIGTSFVSVAPDGETIAEIIWTPLFAGDRKISVQLDPDSVVSEIMRFNDLASVNLRSYFFYDDMEDGARNFRHEATVVRINGESALEYIDIGNVSTGVASSWQALSGFAQTTRDYHSMNSSFHMKEPGPPVDLALVFDTSNSMTGQPLADEKAAALTLVNNLTNDSRVAIFCMASNPGQRFVRPFTLLDAAGRAGVTTTINGLSVQAWTPIWLAFGEAIQYVIDFRSPDRVPAVVALCDGQDYQGSDGTIGLPPSWPADYNQLELGSDDNPWGYAPWWNWGVTQVAGSHTGKYFGKAAIPGYWFTQSFSVADGTRKGLLNAPIPLFTIGIDLEHDPNLPAFSSTSVAANVVDRAQNAFTVYTGAGSQESGTPEYNLYRIATTSPKGSYFYAPSSLDLFGVFQAVGEQLSSLVLARGAAAPGPEAPGPGAPAPGSRTGGSAEGAAGARSPNIPGPNDRYALTQSIDLRGVSSARLSFWHKYSITMGLSGCVVLVGTSADNTTFTYKYVTPGQSYKGNLKTTITRLDDLGSEIRWAWNGISGKGDFDWEFAEVNLNSFCGQQYVRVMFAYLRAGGGGGLGWWIDDVEVRVSRSNSVAVTDTSRDQWELVRKGTLLGGGADTADAWSGDWAWLCHSPSPSVDYLRPGLDNSLLTVPIDLRSALDARLIAKFKFNINYTDGRPPDGFRVEVSSDGGVSWRPINFGVRSAWKVSGTEAAGPDGTSFTGVDLGGNWVHSTSLTRLNCDLTGWAGSVIQLRFRVVTRTDSVNHYHSVTGWGGFYIDDVTVFGNTTTGGRSAGGPGAAPDGAPAAAGDAVGTGDPAPSPQAAPPAGTGPASPQAARPAPAVPVMTILSRNELIVSDSQRGHRQ